MSAEKSIKEQIRERIEPILGWHVEESDFLLSDRDLIITLYKRFQKHFDIPIIDPNE